MLTLKKRQFIDNYKLTRNAYKSCLAVGYSPKNALSYGSKLLKQPEIIKILQEWELEEKTRIEASIIQRKALLNPDRGSFIERTFEKAETIQHAPTAAKYWELGGKVKGFLVDGNGKSDSPIFNIITNELNITQVSDNSANSTNSTKQAIDISSDVSITCDNNGQ